MAVDHRQQVVLQALAGVTDEQTKQDFYYEEVRPLSLSWNPPIRTDCSFYCIMVYHQAGVTNDPSGCGYSGYGNSDSLWNNGTKVTQGQLLAGDIITFGPGGSVHAVICVQTGPDPLCASMGRQGDPSLVRLSWLVSLGSPTFLRFNTMDDAATPVPPRALTTGDLKKAQLILVPNPADAKAALRNGWNLWVWNGHIFVLSKGPHPVGTREYANVHYMFKRP